MTLIPETPNFVEANRVAWNALARGHGSASTPWPTGTRDELRAWLDEFGWLPWDDLRSVLVLCGAGGQQAPTFAALGLEVTLVDLSEQQLAVDRRVANRRGLHIECLQADVHDLGALAGRTFDLVYQPVSTCYLRDPRACYRNVAALLPPGGWYLSDHWNPVQIQVAEQGGWDGGAYRVERPSGTGAGLSVGDPSTASDPQCVYFAHRIRDLLGGICDAGFVIERLGERGESDLNAPPGSRPHLGAYLAPFYEVLARRTATPGPTARPDARPSVARAPRTAKARAPRPMNGSRPAGPTGIRPASLTGPHLARTDLADRFSRTGFIILRDVLDRQHMVPALRGESLRQQRVASRSSWGSYAISDDGSYVSGAMNFTSAPPGPTLRRLHRCPELLRLVRAVAGDDRLAPNDNLAYMYYDDASFIDVHTDVSECELTVLTSVVGRTPPLVAYPRLRDGTPEQLLAVARRMAGRPAGGIPLEVPLGGLLMIDGRRLPHRRPAVQPGTGPYRIAALCFARA